MDQGNPINRYNQRGVSSSKKEVHQVVDKLDRGCFPGAFCKVTEDYLTGNSKLCNVIHSDGAEPNPFLPTCGTKRLESKCFSRNCSG